MVKGVTGCRPAAAVATALLLALVCGCGPKDHPVGGKLTLDGEPLAEADIWFIPEDKEASPAFGKSDAEGNYTLRQTMAVEGLRPGKYWVQITTFFEGIPEHEPPIPERIPGGYNVNSELTAQLERGGENSFDFDLNWQGEVIDPGTYK